LAVNLAQRVITLRELPGAQLPDKLAPMAAAVRAMVSKKPGRFDFFRNADMAALVLESDDVVDNYRDTDFRKKLMENMTQQASLGQLRHAICAGRRATWNGSRTMRRIIARTLFSGCEGWTCGHGRGFDLNSEAQAAGKAGR